MEYENSMNSGKVCWITGLSGAGKTTIGNYFVEELKLHFPNVVFLDGDDLRELFGAQIGHTLDERLNLAKRYSRLCKMLSDQEIIVVCATISMFHEVRKWNRKNITNYFEVYIRTPKNILIERNSKGIYKNANDEGLPNVVGIDLHFEEPENPDITIDNDGRFRIEEISSQLLNKIFGK